MSQLREAHATGGLHYCEPPSPLYFREVRALCKQSPGVCRVSPGGGIPEPPKKKDMGSGGYGGKPPSTKPSSARLGQAATLQQSWIKPRKVLLAEAVEDKLNQEYIETLRKRQVTWTLGGPWANRCGGAPHAAVAAAAVCAWTNRRPWHRRFAG